MRPVHKLALFVAADLVLQLVLAGRHPRASGSELAAVLDVLHGTMRADSGYYMSRAYVMVQSGRPLFPTLFFADHVKYIYPTSSLLVYSVADVLHLPHEPLLAVLIWLSLAGAVWLAGETLLGAMDAARTMTRSVRWQVRVLAAVLAMLFFPLVGGVVLGQIQSCMTFLWMLAVLAWMRGKRVSPGVLVGVICSIKPMLAVFAGWALLRREGRFLWAFLATTLVVQTAAVSLYGWHNAVDYIAVLTYLSHHGEPFFANQSVNGLLERWTHNGDAVNWDVTGYPPYNALVYWGTLVSSAVLLLAGLLVPVWRRWRDRTLDLLLFGMIATVASPIAWQQHYGLFFPGCLYFLGLWLARAGRIPPGFAMCFLVIGSACPFLLVLTNTVWNPLISVDLYAGLAMMGMMGFWMDREVEGSRL